MADPDLRARALIPAPPAPPATLPDVAILAGQIRLSSRALYGRDIAAYLAFCAGDQGLALEPSSLARWRAFLADQTTQSPNTINRKLAAVKRLLKEAAEQDLIDHERAARFAAISGVQKRALKERLKEHARTLITPAQMRKLCDRPNLETLRGRRDRALLHTLASSGLRVSEAAGLRWGDIVPVEAGYSLQVLGKTDIEPRTALLSLEAYGYITTWLAARPVESNYLFTRFQGRAARPLNTPISTVAAWQIVQEYASACELSHIKPHDFRRYFGTQLTARFGIREAQKALGHKSIATTAQYDLQPLLPGLSEGLY